MSSECQIWTRCRLDVFSGLMLSPPKCLVIWQFCWIVILNSQCEFEQRMKQARELFCTYSKTCVKRSLSKIPQIGLQNMLPHMQVKSIAECSKWSILQYFPPSLSYPLSFNLDLCFVYFWVAILPGFTVHANQVWQEAQWLSGRVLDTRPKGRGFEPHRRHCVVVLEQGTFILA